MNSDLEKENLRASCASSESLRTYLEKRATGHNYYKVYTRLERLEYWVVSRAIYLSDGRRWNDIHDREAFNNGHDNVINFGTCFSFSKSESVAMWMLYGGTHKDGVMVDFQRKHIMKILKETESVQLGYWKESEFVPQKVLMKDKFNIRLSDVLYFAESTEKPIVYDIKRSSESIKDTDRGAIDGLKHVKKSYAWNYENECRLILSVDRSDVPEGAYAVKIDLGDTFAELMEENRIYEAPNYKARRHFAKSKLRGEIDWDLCFSCKNK